MTLPDLRKVEPELLQDDIEVALQDSMDIGWTCATGALAVMALLHKLANPSPDITEMMNG